MLAVDWFGCLISYGVLAFLLSGRWRLLRAALALLLGEIGRLLVVLLLGGQLLALTAGGAFTRMVVADLPALPVQAGGLLAAALLALLFGRRLARDTLLYATLSGATMLLV